MDHIISAIENLVDDNSGDNKSLDLVNEMEKLRKTVELLSLKFNKNTLESISLEDHLYQIRILNKNITKEKHDVERKLEDIRLMEQNRDMLMREVRKIREKIDKDEKEKIEKDEIERLKIEKELLEKEIVEKEKFNKKLLEIQKTVSNGKYNPLEYKVIEKEVKKEVENKNLINGGKDNKKWPDIGFVPERDYPTLAAAKSEWKVVTKKVPKIIVAKHENVDIYKQQDCHIEKLKAIIGKTKDHRRFNIFCYYYNNSILDDCVLYKIPFILKKGKIVYEVPKTDNKVVNIIYKATIDVGRAGRCLKEHDNNAGTHFYVLTSTMINGALMSWVKLVDVIDDLKDELIKICAI